MEEIVEYKIVSGKFFESLEKKVNEAIEKGWQPNAPIIVFDKRDGTNQPFEFFQSMVKYKEENNPPIIPR